TRTFGTPATYLGTGADVFNCHVRTSLPTLMAYQNMDGLTGQTFRLVKLCSLELCQAESTHWGRCASTGGET
ncbi:MAG: hypothetical protein IJ526_04840, partial [Lachnospiraceae bacterium]|nr:hypothetical protein [Lachnospiraceae bacterium]